MAPDTAGSASQDRITDSAASPEALIASLRLDAQSEYGRGWNKGMADAVAILRADGWFREMPETEAKP